MFKPSSQTCTQCGSPLDHPKLEVLAVLPSQSPRPPLSVLPWLTSASPTDYLVVTRDFKEEITSVVLHVSSVSRDVAGFQALQDKQQPASRSLEWTESSLDSLVILFSECGERRASNEATEF